jgi:hypothetical protein
VLCGAGTRAVSRSSSSSCSHVWSACYDLHHLLCFPRAPAEAFAVLPQLAKNAHHALML